MGTLRLSFSLTMYFFICELDISRDEDHMKIKTQSEPVRRLRKIPHYLSWLPPRVGYSIYPWVGIGGAARPLIP